MRTQGELEQIPAPLQREMRKLEWRIMEDIVRRIEENGFLPASADWQITRLQQLGKSEKEIKEWIQDAMMVTDTMLQKIFSDEAYKEWYGHERAYQINGMKQIPFEENKELQHLVESVRRQTQDTFRNMTGSLGFASRDPNTGKLIYSETGKFYQNILDKAMLDIHSGAFDYQTTLKRTIETLTASGLRWIDYESGHHNRVDVAARRAVLTGFRQIQGYINEQVAQELHTDRYEVSAHVGARPTHQPWQGRVWTMQELVDVCGLGDVAGLHGANCYHDYRAFPPGAVRTYTDEQLEQMMQEENIPKEYGGRKYTTYEALQKQRRMETAMRAARQQIKLMEAGNADPEDVILKKARYQGQLQAYKEFSKAMGLPEQMKRVYQDGLKGKFTPKDSEKLENRKTKNINTNTGKDRYSKFSDRFIELNNGQKDVITTRRLLNNLNKSNIGKETVRYIIEHPELKINMCYKVDVDENVLGMQVKDEIFIYATKTATVQKTAETIIHELTHHKYDIGGNQWSECVCRAQELKHRIKADKLNEKELRDIIKSVKRDYPEYKWR